MENKSRPYQFLESTTSLCPLCLKRTCAKIVLKENKVFILKHCPEHGAQEELLEENADYYLGRKAYDKPGTASRTQTERSRGCPFDCGLCPEHDQHTCIGLIEVTGACDQACPVCYTGGEGGGGHLPLGKIEKMLDFLAGSEYGGAEIVQLSGGEPALHPRILDIIELARKKAKYVMLNTNGLRLAEDENFARELGRFAGGFELYFQFDGFDAGTHVRLRGKDLAAAKRRALDNLAKYRVPVTLVTTVGRGINDGELGRIVEFGINAKNIRGINFQPIARWGRTAGVNTSNTITVTGIIEGIEKQTKGMLKLGDFIPLPCNVDRVAITYLYRSKKGFAPLTRGLDFKKHLPAIKNTFRFDPEDFLKGLAADPGGACACKAELLKAFRKYIPVSYLLRSEKEKIDYVTENTFRISVTSFIDAHNFDMKSMQKECVHVITPDLKKIPFSAYNMLHRGRG